MCTSDANGYICATDDDTSAADSHPRTANGHPRATHTYCLGIYCYP